MELIYFARGEHSDSTWTFDLDSGIRINGYGLVSRSVIRAVGKNSIKDFIQDRRIYRSCTRHNSTLEVISNTLHESILHFDIHKQCCSVRQ